MANVLNRVTKKFLGSVNTPDYPGSDWIINPDLSAVADQPSKYWDIQGDKVMLLDDIARAAVDAAEVVTIKTQVDDAAQAAATKALAASSKLPSPAGALASTEDRLRALEFLIYGG